MSMWNKTQVLKLIELYEQFPCLYDVRNVEYHNRSRRDDALGNICVGLKGIRPNTTPADVRAKIRNIRSQYAREKSAEEKSKKGGVTCNEVYTPTLYFFDQLKFLNNFLKSSEGKSLTTEEIAEPEQQCSGLSSEAAPTPTPRPSSKDNSFVPTVSKKRKKPSLEEEARRALQLAEMFSSVKEDECDVLGKYLAIELRKIKDKNVFQETKWNLLQVVMEGVKKQFSLESPSQHAEPSSSAGTELLIKI